MTVENDTSKENQCAQCFLLSKKHAFLFRCGSYVIKLDSLLSYLFFFSSAISEDASREVDDICSTVC